MPADPFATHEVLNQSPPFRDVNLFTLDLPLREALEREGGGAAARRLQSLGGKVGSTAAFDRGRLANEHPPQLRAYDEKGHRIDFVEFHPAYHECMALSFSEGLHCGSWEHLTGDGTPKAGANVMRAAGSYLVAQMEAGHCCPITMTNAAVASLREQPDIFDAWLPKILSRKYDPAFRPVSEKASVTIGMAMTEKQGGTDVRANTTRAEPLGRSGPGEAYRITGHKWFMSAPMCDGFLALAQARGGLSCFFIPRFLPDGSLNALRLQRLKDKLGNRSNASSEVEFQAAHGWLIGEEGRGVPTIIEMVTYTRLDCVVSSAGLMRQCLAQALHHARHRAVFGRKLVDQPMMAGVLADLALDAEAATALAFRLARSFDHPGDPREEAWRRLMTPVTKYWVCKIGPAFGYEAMECLGGNGYVEETGLARIYRELPVNAIWEGSGNVMALDVLRVLMKEPDVAALVLDGLAEAAADHRRLYGELERVREHLHKPREIEANARSFVEGLALVAAATLLQKHAPHAIADAFLVSRLEGRPRNTYGAGLPRMDTRALLQRVLPE